MWLLNYVSTHPYTVITYIASDMCLCSHSDVSYLSIPNARSRVGENLFLSNKPQPQKSIEEYTVNGPVHIISKILKFIMSLATEPEIGTPHLVAQYDIELRTCLVEMGHPQPPTPHRSG